jgi:L-aminopeptidase/D-esterase-like protein
MARTLAAFTLAVLTLVTVARAQRAAAPAPAAVASKGLTAVAGLKVGHFTLTARPTGCTVILVDGAGATGGVSQRGGAPGTL